MRAVSWLYAWAVSGYDVRFLSAPSSGCVRERPEDVMWIILDWRLLAREICATQFTSFSEECWLINSSTLGVLTDWLIDFFIRQVINTCTHCLRQLSPYKAMNSSNYHLTIFWTHQIFKFSTHHLHDSLSNQLINFSLWWMFLDLLRWAAVCEWSDPNQNSCDHLSAATWPS